MDDAIGQVLAALAAGTGAGVTDAARDSVTEAAASLRSRLRTLFERNHDRTGPAAMDLFEDDPQESAFANKLGVQLEAYGLGSGEHQDIVDEAQRILSLAGPGATGPGSLAANVVQVWATHSGIAAAVIHGGATTHVQVPSAPIATSDSTEPTHHPL